MLTPLIVAAAPWRVRAVSALPGYRLSVTCNDGTNELVDMPHLVESEKAGTYAALKDEVVFNQVSIELGALTWPNGADLDPEWVHEELGKKTWSPINAFLLLAGGSRDTGESIANRPLIARKIL